MSLVIPFHHIVCALYSPAKPVPLLNASEQVQAMLVVMQTMQIFVGSPTEDGSDDDTNPIEIGNEEVSIILLISCSNCS